MDLGGDLLILQNTNSKIVVNSWFVRKTRLHTNFSYVKKNLIFLKNQIGPQHNGMPYTIIHLLLVWHVLDTNLKVVEKCVSLKGSWN